MARAESVHLLDEGSMLSKQGWSVVDEGDVHNLP
jgi:hypothetical protein